MYWHREVIGKIHTRPYLGGQAPSTAHTPHNPHTFHTTPTRPHIYPHKHQPPTIAHNIILELPIDKTKTRTKKKATFRWPLILLSI